MWLSHRGLSFHRMLVVHLGGVIMQFDPWCLLLWFLVCIDKGLYVRLIVRIQQILPQWRVDILEGVLSGLNAIGDSILLEVALSSMVVELVLEVGIALEVSSAWQHLGRSSRWNAIVWIVVDAVPINRVVELYSVSSVLGGVEQVHLTNKIYYMIKRLLSKPQLLRSIPRYFNSQEVPDYASMIEQKVSDL